MKLQGLTLGRGVLRVYLLLWLLWALVLAFSSHKELLTSTGVTYWTEASVSERLKLKHEAEYRALDCDNSMKSRTQKCEFLYVMMRSSPVEGIVTEENAVFATRVFLLGAVVIPIAVLFVGLLLWFSMKWVFRGFVSNNQK